MAGHSCRGRPSEVVVQHLSQHRVVGESDVSQSLVEANDGPAIHFMMHAAAAMDPHDGGLIAVGLRIHAGSTQCLGPIRGETLDMVGLETVAERVANYFVGHHPAMPGCGKATQSIATSRGLEDGTHASMMTMCLNASKTESVAKIRRITIV